MQSRKVLFTVVFEVEETDNDKGTDRVPLTNDAVVEYVRSTLRDVDYGESLPSEMPSDVYVDIKPVSVNLV